MAIILNIVGSDGASEEHVFCDTWCAQDSDAWDVAVARYDISPKSVQYRVNNDAHNAICETCEDYAPSTCDVCGHGEHDCGGHDDYPVGLAKLLCAKPINGIPLQ